MQTLADVVRQGKALYVGISNYGAEQSAKAISVLRSLGVPCLIHQASYSMLNRWIEGGLQDVLSKEGVGCICFSPLAQGLLTGRYLGGSIPEGSRASKGVFLKPDALTPELLAKLNSLDGIAKERGGTLSSLAILWILRDSRNTSVLIGASSPEQLRENLSAISQSELSAGELERIAKILV
jgi:L-glyceraldehyde 3-phosphate reductase